MKVCHLTSVHTPFDTRIFHKECKALVAAGFEVVLVVPHDADEVRDGVRLHAVPKPANRVERVRRTVWQVYQAARQENAALYQFHDPELIPIGILLALGGHRVVYDVHEDVPADILAKPYLKPWLRRVFSPLFATMEAVGAALLHGISAATPDIARRFPPAKTHLIQNFPDLAELAAPATTPHAERPPQATYVGAINEVRGLREVVAAMGELPAQSPARLALAGNCVPASFEDKLRATHGWERVDFHGWMDRQAVAGLLASSRVGLVTLWPLPTYMVSQPTKLYEYMAAGLPVIASDFPAWHEVVKGEQCGLMVDPKDPKAIANAITWILEHPQEAQAMGERGAQAVRSRYNWAPEAEKLVALTRALARS